MVEEMWKSISRSELEKNAKKAFDFIDGDVDKISILEKGIVAAVLGIQELAAEGCIAGEEELNKTECHILKMAQELGIIPEGCYSQSMQVVINLAWTEKFPVEVTLGMLQKASDESEYKYMCRQCDGGMVLLRRDPEAHKLMPSTHCLKCGTKYVFTDFFEWGEKGLV